MPRLSLDFFPTLNCIHQSLLLALSVGTVPLAFPTPFQQLSHLFPTLSAIANEGSTIKIKQKKSKKKKEKLVGNERNEMK